METPHKPPHNTSGVGGNAASAASAVRSLIVKRRKFLIVVAAFCLLGGTLLVRSHAQTYSVAMEAEDGQKSGNAAAGPTAGASKNASVAFGQGSGGGTNPNPSPGGGGSGTDGTTAAATFNWGTPVKTYDFNDLNGWSVYDNGSRIDFGYKDASNVSVSGGLLTIKGHSDGHTGGMAAQYGQDMGRWETRSKITSDDGSKCWRPVHLLWPDAENFPVGGEIDYSESDGSLSNVDFFLHFGSNNDQNSGSTQVDQSQWHNYAVEWNSQHIAGYVDGKMFFEDTDSSHFPPGPMHPTLQLDSHDSGGTCDSNTTWQVDWMHIYKP